MLDSSYVLYVKPKFLEYDSTMHHYLRFTMSGRVDHFFVVQNNVYFISKENTAEFL